MKRVIRKFFFAAAIAIAALSNVDAQNSFPYQAVIRTAKGELVSNKEIAMQFSLIYDGKVVYSETQKPKTNQYGNVKVEVGKGQKVSGSFAEVPWSTMQVMMKIEADPNGGTNYIDLGTIQLQPAPYAMYAPSAGAVSTVQAGDPKSDSDALFEVKDKDGNVVFAVYPDGVRVFVNDTASKAVSTGFAVAGRRAAKDGEDANIFEVNAAGTQVFVNEEDTSAGKAMQTGFAVSGRKAAKDGSDLFTVGSTGTQVYIDEDATKAISTGFAVSGRKAAKGEEKYLEINADGTRVYIDNEDDSTKAVRTGFAVSGRRAAKEDSNNKMLEINAEGTKIYVGSDGKVMPTGFAVSGRKAAKGKEIKLFEVNSYGTQIYIDAQKDKAMRTGFAVSGRKAAKDGTPDKYMVIDADGTVIYVDYEEAKAMQTGFAVSGRRAAKDGTQNTILKVNNTEGTRVYIEDVDGKAMQTGFAVSGRKAAKEGETDLMRVTGDNTTITAKNLDMLNKESEKNMMSITSNNTQIYTDELQLLNTDDDAALSTGSGNVEVMNDLVVMGDVAQTVDADTVENARPIRMLVQKIDTIAIADSAPALKADKGYALLKIYGKGKFTVNENQDPEKNDVMLFNAAGNLTTFQSEAVVAVIMTKAATKDAKLIIWPLKAVANDYKINFGLMAAGDTANRYVNVEAFINVTAPVECLVDVQSTNESIGTVAVVGPKVYGEKVDIVATPIEGYHFTNWSDGRRANPRTALILHDTAFASANFEINTYKLNITAENGKIEIVGNQNADTTFNHGTKIELTAIADEHYHFMGWTDGEAAAEREFTIKSDTAFEATFAIDSFIIATLAENGEVTGADTYAYGTEIELVATADTLSGFHFVNWSDGNTDNPRKLTVTQDSTFTANFTKNTYALTYIVDGKIDGEIKMVEYEAELTLRKDSVKTGYTFSGWTYNGKNEKPKTMPKGNLTVAGSFTINEYTISFHENNGVWTDGYEKPTSYTIEDETITMPTADNISLDGHTFDGWYTSSQFSEGTKVTAIAHGSTGDTAFYAKWKLNTYSITIAKVVGGEVSVSPDANVDGTYTHGTQVSVSANAEVENGYEFLKWTAEGIELDKDQVTNKLLVFDIQSNVKLTPEFALMKYHISANAGDGGKIKSVEGVEENGEVEHGKTIKITAEPSDAVIYKFAGWESTNLELTEEQKKTPTIEIDVKKAFDITAKFILNTYLVVATNDGNGSVEILGNESTEGSNIFEYGTIIGVKAVASKAYEFDKWVDIEGVTLTDEQLQSAQIQNIEVKSEIKLKATFKPKMAVTLVANGGKFSNNATDSTVYVSNGSAINRANITDPKLEGYSVIDWLDKDGKSFDFNTKITDNITLTAHWGIVYYVASDGDDDSHGGTNSTDDALATIAGAVGKMNNTDVDYKIVVCGTLTGAQTIEDEERIKERDNEGNPIYERVAIPALNITLCGKAGDSTDKIDGGFTETENGVTLTINTIVPVTVKNLTITGGHNIKGAGIYISSTSNVVLDNGAVVCGNQADSGEATESRMKAYGGGVYIDGNSKYDYSTGNYISNYGSLTLRGNACIRDNTAGYASSDYAKSYCGEGAGVYNKGNLYIEGGTISGNHAVGMTDKGSYHYSTSVVYYIQFSSGAGVYNNGSITMAGGLITGNAIEAPNDLIAQYQADSLPNPGQYDRVQVDGCDGGGIYGSIMMTGGEISGNQLVDGNEIAGNHDINGRDVRFVAGNIFYGMRVGGLIMSGDAFAEYIYMYCGHEGPPSNGSAAGIGIAGELTTNRKMHISCFDDNGYVGYEAYVLVRIPAYEEEPIGDEVLIRAMDKFDAIHADAHLEFGYATGLSENAVIMLEKINIDAVVSEIEDLRNKQYYTSIDIGGYWQPSSDITAIANAIKALSDVKPEFNLYMYKVYGMEELSSDAFAGCTILKKIELPISLTSIADNAFNGCSVLSSVQIPNDVTSIGESAFRGCVQLSELVLPENLESIGAGAFAGTALSEIIIPDGVTEIESSTFENCKHLKSIVLPASITAIGTDAFKGCDSLVTVCYKGTPEQRAAITINDAKINAVSQWKYNYCILHVDNRNYNDENSGFTVSQPITFEQAVSMINNPQGNYHIFIDYPIYEAMELPATLNGKAESIKLEGINYDSNYLSGFEGGNVPLTINTSVPVTLKRMDICYGKSVGLAISGNEGSVPDVTIADEVYICQNETENENAKGGGVYLEKGTLRMKGGMISYNKIKGSGYGAGIYIENGATFIMSGGQIIGNSITSGQGTGVYVNGTFKMEGRALVDAANDVYLPSGKAIEISDKLTPPAAANGIIAKVTPQTYTLGKQMLKLAKVEGQDITTVKLDTVGSHFTVTPQGDIDTYEFNVTGRLTTPMVEIGGTYFDGSETVEGSLIFTQGRELAIQNLLVCSHEVTQGEYMAVMNTNPSNFKTDQAEGEVQDNRPVEKVTWYDAINYCNSRSSAENLTPCYTIDNSTTPATVTCNFEANGYRLPTEAEWEYLAREGCLTAQQQTTYSGTNYAWYSVDKTHEVMKKQPNGRGLYDMCGNVWEWCWDWYQFPVETNTPSTGPETGVKRCLRGGSYASEALSNEVEVNCRGYMEPDNSASVYGFRVVRTKVSATSHTVSFNTNGGTDLANITVWDGYYLSKPNITRDGYTFDGWFSDEDCNDAYDFSSPVTESVTLNAKWLTNYNITFDVEGVTKTLSFAEGATPKYGDSDPTKDATAQYEYSFSGWNPELTTVTGNATYTAVFTPAVRKYDITFVIDENPTVKSYEYGQTPSYGSTPTKTADAQYTYTFDKWSPTIATVTGEATYTAEFTHTVRKYQIKFVNYNGTELQSSEVAYGTKPTYNGSTPTKPADSNYTYSFSGWSPTITTVTGAQTYTAQFSATAKPTSVKFYFSASGSGTVTAKVNGSSISSGTELSIGTTVSLTASPASGYKFLYWSHNSSTSTSTSITISASTTSVQAIFTLNQ